VKANSFALRGDGAIMQQDETKAYFRANADDWQRQSLNESGEYNVIGGRNSAVLDSIDRREVRRFLDVGCGTGQLVIAVAKKNIVAEGVDFAPEMIDQSNENARREGVDATFVCGSIFDFPVDPARYDAISAQGFIEYISPSLTDEFFHRCYAMLRPGGTVMIGSRNRLFNAFSLNAFTRIEAESGVLATLIEEASLLQKFVEPEAALQALRKLERLDPQFDRHPETGIPVETRYQYAPADLAFRLRRAGLSPTALYPVHYHGLPIAVKSEQPGLHSEIAHAVAKIGLRDHRLLPFSSTYVVEARRENA
jgi:2-polyprenyl-3-methyl-5-hydroxy-6-metoxy-1,4-benzoquinol methylase